MRKQQVQSPGNRKEKKQLEDQRPVFQQVENKRERALSDVEMGVKS